jgi:oligopeptide transport system substrate-binding protein
VTAKSSRSLILLLSALAVAGCSSAGDNAYFGRLTPPKESVLVLGNAAEPRSLDPHKTAGVPEAHILQELQEGLAGYDPKTLAPVPALATDWQSQDQSKVWIFHLRKGAIFSDGKAITTADFLYSWRRIIDANTASPYASLMYYVKNGQAIAEGKSRLVDPATQKTVMDPEDPTQVFLTSDDEIAQAHHIFVLSAIADFVPAKDAEHLGKYQFKDRKTGQFLSVGDPSKDPELYVAKDAREQAAKLVKISEGKQAVAFKPEDLGVSAIDPYTLRVEMQKPTAFFPKMTPHYAFSIVPQQAIEKYGELWTQPKNFVGCGPYKVTEVSPYNQVVLKKSQTYWDKEHVHIDKIVMLPIQEQSQNVNLYRAGELDAVYSGNLPSALIRELKHYKDFQGGPQFSTYYYSLNVKRKPFNDIRVRRALNLAVDKEAIAYKYVGRGELPATTFVPPGIAGYVPPQAPKYDPDQARKLLSEAGFPGGKGFPPITIYYNTLETHRTAAQAVQRMWKEQLHIDVELQNEEWQTFQARRERRDFDVSRDAWVGDYMDPSTFLDLLTEDTLNNHSGWVDPKYSKLMSQADAEPNEQKRNQLLREAEAYLIDQAPIVPVYFYALNYLKKPWVKGWYPNLLDQHPLKSVSIDPDWNKQPIAAKP